MKKDTMPVVAINADGPGTRRDRIAVLVLTYHVGRAVMACQVLSEAARAMFAGATEQARTQAENLGGTVSNGPLDLGHLVDDAALRNRAMGIAQLYISGQLTRAADIQAAVVEGAIFGVIKGQSGALPASLLGPARLAA